MAHTLILDSSPLSEAARPPGHSVDADALKSWLRQHLMAGSSIFVPEIVDYEVRRELVRSGKTDSVARLDGFIATVNYLPITTAAMRHASFLWAQARNGGWATADPKAIDSDVILAAQALTLVPAPANLVVVTRNFAHLGRYLSAQEWTTIIP